MRHELSDVGAEALSLVGRALRRQIDRAAAVRIDEHRGEPLREERLGVLRLLGREAAAGVGVDVDESRCDVAVGRVDRGLCRGVAERPHRRDAVAANANVGAVPGIAGAIEYPAVANQDVELLRCLCRDAGDGDEHDRDTKQHRGEL